MEKIWLKNYPKEVPQVIDPDIYQSIVDMVDQAVVRFDQHNLLTNMDTSITYHQFKIMSENFASYLQHSLHLKKGDRIAIMMPNIIQYVIAMIGALRAGLVVVNVNPLYTKRELVNQINDAQVNTIVILENFAHTLESALPEMNIKHIVITKLGDLFSTPKRLLVNFVVKYIKKLVPKYHLPQAVFFNSALKLGSSKPFEPVKINREDTAFLQYTGGTTGVAKGAILTHRNICANALQGYIWTLPGLLEGEEEVVLPLPLYHVYSLQLCFIFMCCGSNITLITDPRDIPGFVKILSKKQYTCLIGLNTLFRALLMNPNFSKLDFSKLRLVIAGAMTTSRDVANKWKSVTGYNLSQ
jgi:long-chain acyl-CoA synthetase